MKPTRPLPENRWTLAFADTVSAIGYWVGFVSVIAAGALERAETLVRRATSRPPVRRSVRRRRRQAWL